MATSSSSTPTSPGAVPPLRSIPAVTDREERYRTLFDSCYQPLHAFARRRTTHDEVDDLVAEVLTVAWRRLDDIPADNSLAWLYGVAHRTLANQRRSTTRRRRLVERVAARQLPAPTPPSDNTAVLDALARLRPDDQAILRMAAWEELTTSEIAVALDCTTNAAALRLSRARRRLRNAMTTTEPYQTHNERKVTDG